jgi:hypothetical protein
MDTSIEQALERDRTIDITTTHLKQSVRADLPARATAVLDKAQRREIIATIHQKLSGQRDLEAWVEGSPLVAVEFLIE